MSFDVIVLIPNANKELLFLLRNEGIDASVSGNETVVVKLKEKTKGKYPIPRPILQYKRIIPAVSLIETSSNGSAQIICNQSNGEPLTPSFTLGQNAFFNIIHSAAIIYVKRDTQGYPVISIKTIRIRRLNETIHVEERMDESFPNKYNNAIKAAIAKSKHSKECNSPYYIKRTR
jgi:hypothetical protein